MHKYKVVTTGGGYSVLNNGVVTEVIAQDGTIKGDIKEALAQGSIYIGNSSGVTSELSVKTDTGFLVGNGTTAVVKTMSGEASMANTGAVTLSTNAVVGKALTGYSSTTGTLSASDTIVGAISKLNGNMAVSNRLNDVQFILGTTTATAETCMTSEFDETTTGIGLRNIGSLAVPQVLNANPGATVVSDTVNILHSAGAGDCDDLLGRYTKVAVSGAGDSGLTMVADAPRAYVLAGVAKEVYGSQPWFSHAGTGAITAGSALSAKCDVNADNFTASTVNAGHFHIEGAATVTGQFDGVMIEVYPDVTCLDSALAIAVDSTAVVASGIRISGTPKNGIKFQSGATISSGAGTDDATIKSEQGETAPAGSIYIGANGTVFVMVSTTWTALTIN